MTRLTAALDHALAWIASWWPPRLHQEVAAQYRKMLKECPLAVADMARHSGAYHSTFHRNPVQAAYNEGKRDFYLHVMAMANITPDDLEAMRKETENVD